MKKKILILALLLIGVVGAGCGAASAPPIDLPAPSVGRISISPPDSSGKSTITGTEGAVPSGVNVMAVNQSITGTALLWKITDMLVKNAYAQALPSICEMAGYACTVAGGDGSFTMQIDAAVGNSIYVVIVDEEGNEISPRTQLFIPSTSLSLLGCATESVMGKLVEVKSFNGVPIILFEGDSASNVNNTLQFGTGAAATTISLPGCHAKGLAMYPLDAETVLLAMISNVEQIVWSGIFGTSGLIGVREHTIVGEPHALAFEGDPQYLLVAENDGGYFKIDRIFLDDGSVAASLEIPAPSTGETLNGVLGIRTVGPFADGGFLGAAVPVGIDGSSNNQFFMILFDAKTLDHLSSMPTERLGYEVTGGGLLDPDSLHDLKDFGMDFNGMQIGWPVVILLSDHGSQMARKISLWHDAYTVDMETNTMAELYLDKIFMEYIIGSNDITPAVTVSPNRMVTGKSSDISVAYILTDEHYLWKVEDYPQGVSAMESTQSIPGAVEPVAIALEDPLQTIFVGDNGLKDVLDISSMWGAGM